MPKLEETMAVAVTKYSTLKPPNKPFNIRVFSDEILCCRFLGEFRTEREPQDINFLLLYSKMKIRCCMDKRTLSSKWFFCSFEASKYCCTFRSFVGVLAVDLQPFAQVCRRVYAMHLSASLFTGQALSEFHSNLAAVQPFGAGADKKAQTNIHKSNLSRASISSAKE